MKTNTKQQNVLIVGANLTIKGGLDYVVQQYRQMFSEEIFFYTQPFNSKILNFIALPKVIIHFLFILIKRKSIRIVHLHGSTRGSFYRKYILFILSKYIFKKKTIYHIHGSEFKQFYESSNVICKRMVKHFINNGDQIFCLSKQWKDFFISNFKPINISVIPNSIETNNIFQKVQRKDSRVVFLFLGRIGSRKGVYDLLAATALLKTKNAGLFEVWIGGDGEEEVLKTEIKKFNLENDIHFYGWVAGDLKLSLLSKADVYVLPSYNEGLPISILEAMANGMPVISTPVGGIPELVKNDSTGFLVAPGDIESLSMKMQNFILNKTLVSKLGSNAKSLIISDFDTTKTFKQVELIYNDLIYES